MTLRHKIGKLGFIPAPGSPLALALAHDNRDYEHVHPEDRKGDLRRIKPSEAAKHLARLKSRKGPRPTRPREDPAPDDIEHFTKLRARRQSLGPQASPESRHALELDVARAQYRTQKAHTKASKAERLPEVNIQAKSLRALQRDHPAEPGRGWPGPVQRMKAALTLFKQSQPEKGGKRPPVYLLRKKGGHPDDPDHHVSTVHRAGSPGYEDHEQVHTVEWLLQRTQLLAETMRF